MSATRNRRVASLNAFAERPPQILTTASCAHLSRCSDMVTKKSQTNAEKARKALSGNTSDDVSSGDELGLHQNDWEWIYEVAADGRQQDQGEQPQQSARRRRLSAKMQNSKPGKIVGVKLGHFECRLGDPVVLRAGRNETWVAIIQEFIDDAAEDDKMARFMWFSTPSEIRNKSKRRTDALEVRTPQQVEVGIILTQRDALERALHYGTVR